jgi:hypothetical protein
MSEQENEALAADLYIGATKALEVICRQLIDKKILDADLLIADLVQAQVELAKHSRWASVPAGLAALLGAKSPRT